MENIIAAAHAGCYISVPSPKSEKLQYVAEWCLNCEPMEDNDDQDENDMPDLSIDPNDGVLSIYNSDYCSRTYFVTVENCARIISGTGENLLAENRENSSRRDYITFIVLLQPRTVMDMCTLVPKLTPTQKKNMKRNGGRLSLAVLESIKVTSDIQEYIQTPSPDLSIIETYDLTVFPLQSLEIVNDASTASPAAHSTSWLCTQSMGGTLTHFAHPSTFYAVDFRCPVGTPVIAVFDGVVVEVKSGSTATGVHVSNLYEWNSIMIKRVRSTAECKARKCDTSDEETIFDATNRLTVNEKTNDLNSDISLSRSILDSRHEDELYVEYVHISSEGIRVSVGDIVSAGQVICLSGDAGFCPEPHLHMQMQKSLDARAPSVPLIWRGEPFLVGRSYPSPDLGDNPIASKNVVHSQCQSNIVSL